MSTNDGDNIFLIHFSETKMFINLKIFSYVYNTGWSSQLLIMIEICSSSDPVISSSVGYPVIPRLSTVLEKNILKISSSVSLDMILSFSTSTIFCCPIRLSEKYGFTVFQKFLLYFFFFRFE